MKSNSVLIILDKLDIGGVETFVLNQTKALLKRNKKVIILAKKGIYTQVVEKYGAKHIEYDFTDCIYYDSTKINEIINIIKKYKITEVHIHQFPAINIVMPACLMTDTPYIVYWHMASGIINDPVNNAFDYFERQYITYKKSFEMLFKYATNIVAITETIKNYTSKRYNVDKNKIVVRQNSIDVNSFSSNKKVKQINSIFLISRFSIEKKESIINGIKLYQKVKEIKKDVTLTIAGDGNIREEIEKYIEDNSISDIKFLGSISNVKEEMDKYDMVIGVDRCILEALCLEKIAIISGYDGLKGIVSSNNIDKCIDENFCGINLKNKEVDFVAKEIVKLNTKSINTITKYNSNIIKEKLDINKTVFTLDEIKKVNYPAKEIISDIFEMTEILGKSQQEYYNKSEEIWKAYKNYEKNMNKKYGLVEKIIKIIKK